MTEGLGTGRPSDESEEPATARSPADPVEQLRALPDRYREVLGGHRAEPVVEGPEDLPREAVEEAAQARDLLDSTARKVQRLLEDSKPVPDTVERPSPRRGRDTLDAEVVLDVLDAHAERLAQLVEAVPEVAGDRKGVREGLQSITGEIVGEAVSEGERRLREAERSIDEKGLTPPTSTLSPGPGEGRSAP